MDTKSSLSNDEQAPVCAATVLSSGQDEGDVEELCIALSAMRFPSVETTQDCAVKGTESPTWLGLASNAQQIGCFPTLKRIACGRWRLTLLLLH